MAESPELLEQLLSLALRIRVTEEEIAREYAKQEMKTPTHLHIGQEAVPAGVCAALRKDDLIFGYYRSHGWYLAKGGNLQRMLDELYGKATGCSGGYGGSMHLIDLEQGFTGTTAIVAGQMPHAVGAAFGFRHSKSDRVAVTCFGDGATEEGLFQESLMFAQLRKLPVLFVCENNGLATNTWIQDRQPPQPIFERAKGHGIASFQVDGNDAVAVHRQAQAAVARARRGEGPTFLECVTYRYLEHCGPQSDVPLGFRTDADVAKWKERDPIKLLEQVVPPATAARLRADYLDQMNRAFVAAKAAPAPTRILPEGMSCHA